MADDGRAGALDGLRAFAVGAVILCHTMIAPGGFLGVDVFFALSGYLITSLLLKEHARAGEIALGRFYLRRTLRLMPALFAMLTAVSAYDLIFRSRSLQADSIQALPAVIFYVGNWYQAANGVFSLDLWNHTWSLAVEEQFYLLWPVILIFSLSLGRSAPAWAAGLLGVASVAWRVYLSTHGATEGRIRGTDATADLLMCGCLLAILMARNPQTLYRAVRWVAAPALALLAVMVIWPAVGPTWSALAPTLAALLTCAVIANAVNSPLAWVNRMLAYRPLVIVGRLSYAIYLWHVPVTMALVGHIHNHWALTLAVSVVSLGLAVASWIGIEYPMQLLRDRAGRLGPRLRPRSPRWVTTSQ